MSGGHFDFRQSYCDYIAEDIQNLIENRADEFPEDVIERFKEAVTTLRRAYVMAQRIDWLISGDDGVDSFRRRWEEDLSKLPCYPAFACFPFQEDSLPEDGQCVIWIWANAGQVTAGDFYKGQVRDAGKNYKSMSNNPSHWMPWPDGWPS